MNQLKKSVVVVSLVSHLLQNLNICNATSHTTYNGGGIGDVIPNCILRIICQQQDCIILLSY